MPLTQPAPNYRKVKDVYDSLKQDGVVTQSLPEWSAEMNRLTKTDLFSAGLHDNFIKRASVEIDKTLEDLGLPQITKPIGGEIGALVGDRATGERLGAAAPRGALNMASFLIPGAGWANAARLGLAGLMTGAEAYTETGSPASGVISAGTTVALPGIAGAGERLAAKYGFGKVGQFFGGQATAAGAIEGEKATESVLKGEVPRNPLSVENLLNLTLGQVPFAAIHGISKLGSHIDYVHPSPDTINHAVEAAQKVQVQNEAPRIEATTPDPAIIRETAQRLAQLRGEQVRLDPTNVEEANRLLQEEHATLQQHTPTSNSVFGDTIAPESPREQVVGRDVTPPRMAANGKARAVEIADLPVNPEELRKKIVVYSTAYEPNPTLRSDGYTVFGLPDAQWRTPKSLEEWNQRKAPVDPNQPDLPQQETPATNIFAHLQDLKKVEIDVDTARTPAEMQKAVVRLQGVQQENGIPPTNDATIKPLVEELTKQGDPTPVQTAVKITTKRTARMITAPPLTEKEAANISARMEGKGFSVVGEDKLSHKISGLPPGPTRQIASNILEDAAYSIMLPNVKTNPKDSQMFMTLVSQLGKTSNFTPSEVSDVAQYISDRDGTTLAESTDSVNAFLAQPHAKEWEQQLEAKVQLMRQNNAEPGKPSSLEAGKGWLFSLAPYDAERNVLGGKHTLPRTGVVEEAALRNMGGTAGKPLTKAEMELYRTIAPEAFDGTKVNVPTLVKGLREKGPQVETRTLSDQNPTQQAHAASIHVLDTEFPDWRTRSIHDETLTTRQRELLTNYHTTLTPAANSGEAARYSFLGPKPESDMPGYVEGLVRTPSDLKAPTEQVKYAGPHFGSEDRNVLSFYRGYEETLSNGEKAFHVIEVQSDWGQARRIADEKLKQDGFDLRQEDGKWWLFHNDQRTTGPSNIGYATKEEAQSVFARRVNEVAPQHPLLHVYESLALKAAIQHAKEVGATKVILSDAETAMMTEGHDRATEHGQTGTSPLFDTEEAAIKYGTSNGRKLLHIEGDEQKGFTSYFSIGGAVIPQAKGMRLHYDQTLPSAMEKLTGEKGKGVELGVHKGALAAGGGIYNTEAAAREHEAMGHERLPITPLGPDKFALGEVGSPVFRDSSGAPKTQITGRAYDISNLPSEFTLTEPNRAPEFTPFVPETPIDIRRVKEIGTTGTDLHKMLEKAQDPITHAFYEATKPFADLLARTEVAVGEGKSGSSYALNKGDGKTAIVISPGTLQTLPENMYRTVAHELSHTLTISELDNPTKKAIVDEFHAQRQRLITALPTSMRGAYNRAISEGWYGKWARGEVTWDTLFSTGTTDQRQILYGLLTTKEMVSQGMTRKSMQDFMKSTKFDGTYNGFSKFVDTVKRLLGFGIKGTEFEQFLANTGNLIEHGDYVASFRDFSERYFENQGLNDSMVQGNTRRALSVIIGSESGATKEDVLTQLGQDVSVKSLEYNIARRQLGTILDKTNPEFTNVEQIMGELGYEPSVRGHDDFLHETLMGREAKYATAIDVMPKEAQDYLFAKANDMRSVLGVLRAATEEYNRGLINLADPKLLSGPVRDAMKAVEKIKASEANRQENYDTVRGLLAVEPDGFFNKFIEQVPSSLDELDNFTDDNPTTRSRFKNFFQQVGQLARENPKAAEALALGTTLQARGRDMAMTSLRPFGVTLGEPNLTTKEGVKAFSKLISNKRVERAADLWTYWSNKKGGDKVSMLPFDDPDVAKALQGLSDQDRKDVTEIVQKRSFSIQTHQQQTLSNMLELATTRGASIPMLDKPGTKTEAGVQMSGTLLKALIADRKNPQEAQMADAQIASVQQQMSPQGFLDLLKFSQAEVEKYNQWKEHFVANPDWASFQRQERYLIEYIRGKKLVQDQGSSIKEVLAKAEGAKIVKQPWDQWAGKEDIPLELGHLSPEQATRMMELDQNQVDILKNKGMPEAYLDLIRQTGTGQQFARETAATQGIQNFVAPARLLSKGADELPVLWNHISYVERSANYWSRQLFRSKMEAHLMGPDVAGDPKLQADLRQHMDNMLQPDPAVISKINKVTATWQMGLSPATAIIIGTHGLTRHTTELTSMTGKPIDSFLRIGKSLSQVVNQALFRRGKDWSTEDHAWLMQRAARDLQVEQDWHDDTATANEGASLDFKNALMKNKVQTVGQRLGTLFGSVSDASMWMVQQSRRVQEQIALLASFDYYREQGQSREDAQKNAYQFNQAVNPVGGRAQRPIGMFAGEGDFSRGVAMLGNNMKSYVLGTVGQLARHVQSGWLRPAAELTPSETYNHRAAAVQMMAVQLTAAGLLGLPGTTAAISLLDKLFPSLELNKKLRETVKDFFDGDQSHGSVWSDIAMTGVPSMMGWDWQSRLSMGNLVPGVSENNGFQPGLLLGPTAGVVSNFVNGIQQVSSGDIGGVTSFLPPGIKKLVTTIANEGTVKDWKDRPLFQPSLGEATGLALGFNPKQLSDFNAASRMETQSQNVVNRREGQFHQHQAEQVLAGNFGNVRAALQQRAQSEKGFSPLDAVRSIAQSAEELTFPRELRREGTARTSPDRQRLLSTFNLPPSEPSEVDRLKFRLGVQERLGLRTDPRRELQEAAMVDELQRQEPTATRSELRQKVNALLRRHPQNVSLLPE